MQEDYPNSTSKIVQGNSLWELQLKDAKILFMPGSLLAV